MDMTLNDAVAEELRALAARRRMTATRIGETIGRGQMWVGRKLRGASPITVDELALIAAALDAPLVEIMAGAQAHITRQYFASVSASAA